MIHRLRHHAPIGTEPVRPDESASRRRDPRRSRAARQAEPRGPHRRPDPEVDLGTGGGRSASPSSQGSSMRSIHLAAPAISEFGLGFLTTNDWNPVTENFGALSFIYGTVVTSAIALLFAAPLSIAIALYLTELVPAAHFDARWRPWSICWRRSRASSWASGASSSSGPFMRDTIEPALHSVARLPADIRRRPVCPRPADRGGDPDDHDRADRLQRYPGSLRDRSGRAEGGRLRAWSHSMGDGPDGHPALLRARA